MRAFLLTFSLFFGVLASISAQDIDLLPRGSETVFKATFNVQGTKMSGFLAAKYTVVGVLHVEFTTPMGNNLITMKWEEGRWKQEYAVRQLKNRFVMETLGEDLKYILGYYIYDEDFLDLCDEWVWGNLKLIPDYRKGKVHAMHVYTKQEKLDRTIMYKYREGKLVQVSVDHPNIPYSLQLETIEKK
jgi:hypothetical protein